jgi:methyltransferase (TIGR00027 family)
MAIDLLPPPLAALLRTIERSGRGRRVLERALRSGGLVGHLELRTALVDEAVREAVAEGCRQLVLLGAGLDTRAWRMPELEEIHVFEVDLPATQAWKRRRVDRRMPLARSVEFLPIDFETMSLADALAATKHDESAPTIWVWEGVTPYLEPMAIEETIADIEARSAPESRLVLTYATPDLLAAGPLRRLADSVMRSVGEPLRSTFVPAQMASKLEGAGFRVLSDVAPMDVGERHGRTSRPGWISPAERVLRAEKST